MNGESRPVDRAAIAAADLITIAAALAVIVLALLGPLRVVVADRPVTLGVWHALFLAVSIAVLRHALVSAPSLVATVRDWFTAIARHRDLSEALLVSSATRPAVLAIGFAAAATFGVLPSSEQAPSPRNTLRDLPARFDANWYAGIAAYGYEFQGRFDRQQNFAFFPAYPLAMRTAGAFTGAYSERVPMERRITRFAWAGLAISLVAFVFAAWYFAALAREILGDDGVRPALLLLATYPFAVYFSAAYTESLFLVAALATWFHSRREEFLRATAWGLLLGLTRPNGFFLAVPLGLIALGVADAGWGAGESGGGRKTAEPATDIYKWRRFSAGRLTVAIMPVVGMLLFTLWLRQRTDVWFAWARIHGAWGRVVGTTDPGWLFESFASQGLLRIVVDHPYQSLNAIGLLFAMGLIGAVWRRLGPAWAAYILVSVGAPLAAGGVLSMGRLTSTLFPLFLTLAAVLPARAVPLVGVAFALMQGLVAALFYTWRDMY
jgi:hypothetical protein